MVYCGQSGCDRRARSVEGAPVPPPLSRLSFDVSGRNFIITGGTQGLGLEIARQLKACGATSLALMARTRARGEQAVAELTDERCAVHFVEVDLSDAAALQAAAAEAIRVMGGRVDGLVNTAAITVFSTMMDMTADTFHKTFDTNTLAPLLLTQAVSKHLIERGARGAIVSISSSSAKGGYPTAVAYAASKAALNIITQNNAAELAPHGIRANVINMGMTLTEFTEEYCSSISGNPDWLSKCDPQMPLKRIMRSVDVACMVCFLLSPAAEMVTGNIFDMHPDIAFNMLSLQTSSIPGELFGMDFRP